MSPNILALVQRGAYTVTVSFQGFDKEHTYVANCHIRQLVPGDFVVVKYHPKDGPERLSVAQVRRVDSQVTIAADDMRRYDWVVSVIDIADYLRIAADEQVIKDLLEKSEARRQREQVFTALRDTLDNEAQIQISGIIGSVL